MKNFTKNELKILAHLLSRASDEFHNHGCNDYEMKNTKENLDLINESYGFIDEDKQEFNPDDEVLYGHDACLMSYFSDKILELLNE